MANANGWGDGASNNNIGWGKGADNAIGWGSVYSVSSAGATDIVGTPAVDPDAQAFITAASITDPTQQAAINTLVVDLKGYNIWTKFKAIYPVVGGVASSHAVNLKTPGTFNLSFATGVTHSANGMVGNGTTGYANSNLNAFSTLTNNNTHISFYSRTSTITNNERELSCFTASDNPSLTLGTNTGVWISDHYRYNQRISGSITAATGLYVGTRTTSTSHKLYKNGVQLGSTDLSTNPQAPPNGNLFILATNLNPGIAAYSTKQCAFASIGDGLSDTEAANFYTAVQAYQVTLGRSIGTQTVSDADAQAFVTAANIDDQVQANAVNNLVIGMKADSLWTKMKAIYPVVGGIASSHAVNLKTPGTYNLTFASGWTHSSTGMTPLNAYADTSLIPNSVLSLNSTHISGYIRNNIDSGGPILSSENAGNYDNGLYIWPKQSNNLYSIRVNDNISDFAGVTYDVRGLHLAIRTGGNVKKYRVNTTQIFNSTSASYALNTSSIYIGKSRNNANYFNNEIAFSSIGDGLTDAEAANLYTRVNTFQTALSRNV